MIDLDRNSINDFILLSKYAGMREDLVQAGGGNTSYKMSDEIMIIKASGYQLTDVSKTKGYAIVNSKIIKNAFENEADFSALTENKGDEILKNSLINEVRPSIETFLHSFTGRYTLHTHPIVANILLCRENWKKILETLFPDAVLVPYAIPGVELAKMFYKAYNNSYLDKKKMLFFFKITELLLPEKQLLK